MADIIILCGKHRAYILAESAKGLEWIKRNVVIDHDTHLINHHYSIDRDDVEDAIKSFQEEELTVEVKH